MNRTRIETFDYSWNPIVGCRNGCPWCYARRFAERGLGEYGQHPKGSRFEPRLLPERLGEPMQVKKPARIFAVSMGDLFSDGVEDDWRDKVVGAMDIAFRHTFFALTKRPDRMREYIAGKDLPVYFCDGTLSPKRCDRASKVVWAAQALCDDGVLYEEYPDGWNMDWPLPNLWLGVSVMNQPDADERIPLLLQTPAAHRFVSFEPFLSRIRVPDEFLRQLDWAIIGLQTGPSRAEVNYGEVEALTADLIRNGVPIFHKNSLMGRVDNWSRDLP